MNIILIAPPAAGKGTQAGLLCNKYNLNHISTGDLLRNAIESGSELSKELTKQMNDGKLISDNIIIQMIEEEIKDKDQFIYDGFPRNINQAKLLDDLLRDLNKKIDYVFYLKIDKEVALNRVIGRSSCPSCGHIYNDKLESMMPKKAGICDDCNIALFKRLDDNEETFNKRFETYINETAPIIEYYRDKNILYEIDSSKSKEDIFLNIERIIDNDKN